MTESFNWDNERQLENPFNWEKGVAGNEGEIRENRSLKHQQCVNILRQFPCRVKALLFSMLVSSYLS